jgi:hypothetical protein
VLFLQKRDIIYYLFEWVWMNRKTVNVYSITKVHFTGNSTILLEHHVCMYASAHIPPSPHPVIQVTLAKSVCVTST